MITRAIVCGSRDFCDQEYCFSMLDSIFSSLTEIEIISGHAKGADQMAEAYAKLKGIPVKTFLPDWKRYGKGAGPFRNQEMLDHAKEAQPLVIAFWDGKSRGTKSQIDIAQREGVEVKALYPSGEQQDSHRTDLEYLHFEIGGFLSDYKKLTIRNRDGILELDGFFFPKKPKQFYGLHFHDLWSKERSQRWIRKIKMIHFESWESDYDDPSILDGTQWSLRYKNHGENERKSWGSNAYPDNWADFLKIVNDIMKRLPTIKDNNIDTLVQAMLCAESGINDAIDKDN